MNWIFGTTLAMACVLAGALVDGPSDTQAAQDAAQDAASTQQDARTAQAEAARQARIDATLARGTADLQRLDATLQQARPDDVSPADWAMAQRAVGIAMGRE